LISRILGAMVRSILIFIGIFSEILILIFGLIFFFGWLILPVLLTWGLFFGIKFLI